MRQEGEVVQAGTKAPVAQPVHQHLDQGSNGHLESRAHLVRVACLVAVELVEQ